MKTANFLRKMSSQADYFDNLKHSKPTPYKIVERLDLTTEDFKEFEKDFWMGDLTATKNDGGYDKNDNRKVTEVRCPGEKEGTWLIDWQGYDYPRYIAWLPKFVKEHQRTVKVDKDPTWGLTLDCGVALLFTNKPAAKRAFRYLNAFEKITKESAIEYARENNIRYSHLIKTA